MEGTAVNGALVRSPLFHFSQGLATRSHNGPGNVQSQRLPRESCTCSMQGWQCDRHTNLCQTADVGVENAVEHGSHEDSLTRSGQEVIPDQNKTLTI